MGWSDAYDVTDKAGWFVNVCEAVVCATAAENLGSGVSRLALAAVVLLVCSGCLFWQATVIHALAKTLKTNFNDINNS